MRHWTVPLYHRPSSFESPNVNLQILLLVAFVAPFLLPPLRKCRMVLSGGPQRGLVIPTTIGSDPSQLLRI